LGSIINDDLSLKSALLWKTLFIPFCYFTSFVGCSANVRHSFSLLAGSAFTTSDNLSLSSWVSSSTSFPGFQHPQSLSALGTSTASIATPIPHPIQGSLPPYSRLGMPLTPSAIASSMQGSGPTFPSFHMPRYHHYFQQGPYAAIQGLRHSSAVMTPFVWLM